MGDLNPTVIAAIAATLLVAFGTFLGSLATGAATLIVAMRTTKQAKVVEAKLDGNTAELEKIHPLVNSNMTRMFVAVGVQSFFILVLVWFGLKEAQKPKEMEFGMKGARPQAGSREPARV